MPISELLLAKKRNELGKLIEHNAELSIQLIDLQQLVADICVEKAGVVQEINQIILEIKNGTQLRQSDSD
jgi:hypothetical protein